MQELWDTPDRYIRSGHVDKDSFIPSTYRTIDIDPERGIKAAIGKLKSNPQGGMVVQSYLFDKEKWTVAQAKKWFRDHQPKNEGYATEEALISEAKMHPDFAKILQQFQQRFGEEDGKARFDGWVQKRGLDTSKAYSMAQLKKAECLGGKCSHKCAKCLRESFQWAKPLIKLLKNDETGKTYQVEAHFAVTSMNRNVYTKMELAQAVSTFPGKHVDLNHNLEWKIDGVDILAAAWEDGAVECLIHVANGAKDAKGRDVQTAIEDGTIDCVSIEGDAADAVQTSEGNQPVGFYYTGLALLDQDALPGIPLTTIRPVEDLFESLLLETNNVDREVNEKMTENTNQNTKPNHPQEANAMYCPMCGQQLVDGACPNKECAAYGKQVQMSAEQLQNITAANQKIADLTEQLTKQTAEQARLQTDLSNQRSTIEKLSRDLAAATRENVKVAIGEAQNSNLKEQLTKTITEANELRGKIEAKSSEISRLEERINKEHAALIRTEELLGKREAELDAARRELNEESTRRAVAEQKALNETKERSRIQLENASVLEEKAKDTRTISNLTEKLSEAANKLLRTEKELADAKTELSRREEAIKAMQGNNEKALIEQKRLYKILKENGIYQIDTQGNIVVPT